ncbi:acyl-CoA thioesterase [Desulfopila sp. IMCC35006]|uniref:acyl-CoA thioesterase n=1 Tax=Desulfopila sp. IMCC35006 TaxID=2569542 RepID=UPI0010ABA2B4|nr:thioesterase family protein [Desulfopila sp. IMCC35006]TKB26971.1 acyl-CoA thioesterase [Desulfopila sp. IMCC35006]
MEYLTEIKVRGYHADFYGHVNNARYLEFFEEDRWATLESKIDLKKWAKQGIIFLVVNINVNYRLAVPVGETLVATTTIEKIGNRSVVLNQQILIKESKKVAADALITFVIADKTGRAVAMEGEMLQEIEKLRSSGTV